MVGDGFFSPDQSFERKIPSKPQNESVQIECATSIFCSCCFSSNEDKKGVLSRLAP